ncbi:MAG: hypothetical protein NTV68_07560, partial [Methanomicrobiales archaeon]|nr:hypothetical protein [Methanomicrobiales archaeon]
HRYCAKDSIFLVSCPQIIPEKRTIATNPEKRSDTRIDVSISAVSASDNKGNLGEIRQITK